MDNDNKEYLIAWKESYMLGIPMVDEEHKKLVGLCNNLHNAILSNKHDSLIKKKCCQKNFKRMCRLCTDSFYT